MPAAQLTESPPEDPLQLSRNTVQQQTAIIAFTARYYSGMPFQVLPFPCCYLGLGMSLRDRHTSSRTLQGCASMHTAIASFTQHDTVSASCRHMLHAHVAPAEVS